MEKKRKVDGVLAKILEVDVKCSQKVVDYLLQLKSFKALEIHGTALDLSCNGAVWFPVWVAFIWLLNNRNLYEMQINMLIALIIDVIIVALLKASIRRRRPTADPTMLSIGPDKFSFPSGHTSRAFMILLFFTILYPLPMILWMPLIAWASSVALSRLLLRRHYILDICAGILIAAVESLILNLLWVSHDNAISLIQYFASEDLPDGGLED